MPPSRPRSGVSRDTQRARVYAAEDAWALLLDAARQGAGRAVVAGSSVVLPAEVRFGDLAAAQVYADHQLTAWPVPPVVLRVRKGQLKAHWQAPATLALPIPEHGTPWALREAVLLHELAHHLAFHLDAAGGHGPRFVTRMLELVEHALGPEAALALRVDYGEQQVV
jgi:putative metallohydrolase (TIGR04338 family)